MRKYGNKFFVRFPKIRMMRLYGGGKKDADPFWWRCVVCELVSKDTENRVYLSRLHGTRRIQINGDIFIANFGVAKAVALEFSNTTLATAKGSDGEGRKTEDDADASE